MHQPEIESISRDALRRMQDRRLRDLLGQLAAKTVFYPISWAEHRVDPSRIRGVEDLPKLPFTRKDDLRASPTGFLAIARRDVRRFHASSGTTGRPTVIAYSRGDLDLLAEVNARSLAAAGARPGMTLHNAYGYGLFTGGLGLHDGGERLGLAVIPVSGGVTERQIALIQDLRPHVISCTPSYAQRLAMEFRGRGTPAGEISLRFAILGAEPWSEAIRREVDAGLGVSATNLYGLSEVIGPGVAAECGQARSGSHVWEDHFYPEIVDPSSGDVLSEGEEGVLVLTTLTKQAMPLIRYWTGDITRLIPELCPCGRTHRRMGPVRGRDDDMLIVRGVNLYPSQIEECLAAAPHLEARYELVLRRRGPLDELEVRVELTREAFGASPFEGAAPHPLPERLEAIAEDLRHRVRSSLGLGVLVTLLAPGQAPRSEGGKLNRVRDHRDVVW